MLIFIFCRRLKSAHQNNRKWIGIDESEEAIKASIKKLNEVTGDLFVVKADYRILSSNKKLGKKKRDARVWRLIPPHIILTSYFPYLLKLHKI